MEESNNAENTNNSGENPENPGPPAVNPQVNVTMHHVSDQITADDDAQDQNIPGPSRERGSGGRKYNLRSTNTLTTTVKALTTRKSKKRKSNRRNSTNGNKVIVPVPDQDQNPETESESEHEEERLVAEAMHLETKRAVVGPQIYEGKTLTVESIYDMGPLDEEYVTVIMDNTVRFMGAGFKYNQSIIRCEAQEEMPSTGYFASKFVVPRKTMVCPAFPIVFMGQATTFGEMAQWFLMGAGLGHIYELNQNTAPGSIVYARNSDRMGAMTIYTHRLRGVAKLDGASVTDIPFSCVRQGYRERAKISMEYWTSLGAQQRAVYMAALHLRVHYTLPKYDVHVAFAYATAKMIFTFIQKIPTAGFCKLMKTLCNTDVEFVFDHNDLIIWNDVNVLTIEQKIQILDTIAENRDNFPLVFQILIDRMRTYGLSSLHTIIETIDKFPNVNWVGVGDRWFSGQMEKFVAACHAFKNSRFPALETELLKQHSMAGYKDLAAFCANILRVTGANRHISQHKGLNKYKLSADQRQFLETIRPSGKPKALPINKTILDAINGIKGIEMSPEEEEVYLERIKRECEERYGEQTQTVAGQLAHSLAVAHGEYDDDMDED